MESFDLKRRIGVPLLFGVIVCAILSIMSILFMSEHNQSNSVSDTPVKTITSQSSNSGVVLTANGRKLSDLTAEHGDAVYDQVTLTSNSKLYSLKVTGLTARLNFKPDGGGTALHVDQMMPEITIPKNGSASANSPHFSPTNFGWTDGKWRAGTYYFDILTSNNTKWVNAADGTVAQMSADLNLMGEGVASETFTVKPAPITVTYKAHKEWQKGTNKANITDFKVNFYLKGNGTGTVQESKIFDADGNVTFAYKDTFTSADVGKTFYRSAKEVDNDLPGVQYDTAVKTYTVTVRNDHGVLKADMNPADATVRFTNTSITTGASAVITASKLFSNAPMADAKITDFTFRLYDAATGKLLQNNVHPAQDGTVTFAPRTYKVEDLNGASSKTFKYYVMEVKGSAGGVQYDTHKAYYTVTVTDNHDGSMSAKVASDGSSSTQFVNKYVMPNKTYVTLSASKKFVNGDRSNVQMGQFTFKLYNGLNATGTAVGNPVHPDANGKVTFPAIPYQQDQLDGQRSKTFDFSIKETKLSTTDGIKYETKIVNAHVTIRSDGKGKLVADPVVYDGGPAEFTNTYEPKSTTATIGGVKQFNNSKNTTTPINAFQFKLYDDTGNELQTTNANADGSYSFQPITYTSDMLGISKSKTFKYTVKEVQGNAPGVTYDTHTANFTVTVTDPGAGQLTATVTDNNGTSKFTNTYKPAKGTVTLKAHKTLENANLMNVDMSRFQFTVKDESGKIIRTASPDVNGNITFAPIEYTQESTGIQNGVLSKTYKYTVSETDTKIPGIVYATNTVTYTVTVTDNKNGQLVTTVTPNPNTATPQFTNKVHIEPVHVTPKATKVFENKELSKTDITTFAFNIYHGDKAQGNPVFAQPSHPAKDGSITFPQLDYTMADLTNGTKPVVKTYSIKEVKGNAGGVTYTDKISVFTVTLTNNQNGTMTATISQPAGQTTQFTNTYKATPTDYTPVAVKTYLYGSQTVTMSQNQFKFQLKDNTGKVLQEVGNQSNGQIVFNKIPYDKASTYSYTIMEKPGDDKRIEYDTSVYTLTVKVSDDGYGKLSATGTYTINNQPAANNKPSFTNKTRSAVSMPLTGSLVDTGTLTRAIFTTVTVSVLMVSGIIMMVRRKSAHISARRTTRHGR